jgi:hypothetical protein
MYRAITIACTYVSPDLSKEKEKERNGQNGQWGEKT